MNKQRRTGNEADEDQLDATKKRAQTFAIFQLGPGRTPNTASSSSPSSPTYSGPCLTRWIISVQFVELAIEKKGLMLHSVHWNAGRQHALHDGLNQSSVSYWYMKEYYTVHVPTMSAGVECSSPEQTHFRFLLPTKLDNLLKLRHICDKIQIKSLHSDIWIASLYL